MARFLFQVVEINELIDDSIDRQTGGGMDIELGGDMLAVGDNGVHGDAKHIRDFFVT